ncbi:MAG: GumC family protein [Oceanococcus sp.]
MTEPDASSIRIQKRLHCLFIGIWLRRRLILVPLVIMPIVGTLIGLTGSKTYQTYTSILIQEPALFNPFLEDLAVATNLEDRMPGLTSLVHSRHVLTAVGQDLGQLDENENNETIEWYVSYMSYKLDIDLVGSDLVKIYFTDDDPRGMREVLDAVTKQLVNQIVAPEKSSVTSSAQFLRDQLDERHRGLLVAEQALADYKSKNSEKLPELHAANVSEAQRLTRTLAEKRTELSGAQAQLSAARQKLSQANPLLGNLEKVIIDLRARLAQASASYTDAHSEVRGVQRKLDHLLAERSRILEKTQPLTTEDLDRLWNMLTTPELSAEPSQQSLLYLQLESLHIATQKEQGLTRELEFLGTLLIETQEKIRAFGTTEMQLNELTRDLQAKQEIYSDLLKRWELAQVTRALGEFEAGERIKIIDPPFTPSSPINLPWFIYSLVGLLGGLMAGLGMAFVLEVLDTRIKRSDEVTSLTGLPVLARISGA